MSALASRPYDHYGVLIPWASTAPDEWIQEGREAVVAQGFLLVEIFQENVYVVQSVETGELYIHKTVKPGSYQSDPPEEIRISTCPLALRQLPAPYFVGRVETIHFNELVAWQKFKDDNDGDWYTLIYR